MLSEPFQLLAACAATVASVFSAVYYWKKIRNFRPQPEEVADQGVLDDDSPHDAPARKRPNYPERFAGGVVVGFFLSLAVIESFVVLVLGTTWDDFFAQQQNADVVIILVLAGAVSSGVVWCVWGKGLTAAVLAPAGIGFGAGLLFLILFPAILPDASAAWITKHGAQILWVGFPLAAIALRAIIRLRSGKASEGDEQKGR